MRSFCLIAVIVVVLFLGPGEDLFGWKRPSSAHAFNPLKLFKRGKRRGGGKGIEGVEGSSEGVIEGDDAIEGGNEGPTLCALFIARDEAKNIRAHLPLWNEEEKVFDCYVAGIDSRSEDDTKDAIKEVFKDLPGVVFKFNYDGLGNARTEVLGKGETEGRSEATVIYHVII